MRAAAGALSMAATPATRPMPFVFSAGEVDDRVTTKLGIAALPLDERFMTDYPMITSLFDAYRTVLQLGPAYAFRSETIAGQMVARFTFEDSTVGAANVLEVLVIEGLRHQYPNGTNHPVNMPDVLWPFFSAHALPACVGAASGG